MIEECATGFRMRQTLCILKQLRLNDFFNSSILKVKVSKIFIKKIRIEENDSEDG